MAKIAVSSSGSKLDSAVEVRFGRCPYFIICGEEADEHESFQNPGFEAGGGAGVKAAQAVADLGVEILITGKIGPNAEDVLKETGIKVYEVEGSMTVKEALQNMKEGKLKKIL